MFKTLIRRLAAAIVLATVHVPAALAAWELNMPEGVTSISREIYGIHMMIFWICVGIAVLVFGVMIYSIVRFRRSKGAVPATFHHSTTAEIVWTVIPIIILVVVAVPAARALVKIEDTRAHRMVDLPQAEALAPIVRDHLPGSREDLDVELLLVGRVRTHGDDRGPHRENDRSALRAR